MELKDLIERVRKEEVVEEKEEEKEQESEKKKVDTAGTVGTASAVGTKSADVWEGVKAHILEARQRFLLKNPSVEPILNDVYLVALDNLKRDYMQGNIRSLDFYDYMQEAFELYKKALETKVEVVKNIPIREEGGSKTKEKELTRDEYFNYYIQEYLPSITKKGKFIENIVYPGGERKSVVIEGKEDWVS